MTYLLLAIIAILCLVLAALFRFCKRLLETPQPSVQELVLSLSSRLKHAAADEEHHDLWRSREILFDCLRDIDRTLGRRPLPYAPKKLSATKLAKLHKTTPRKIQASLQRSGYIVSQGGVHLLTDLGVRVGGEYLENHRGVGDGEGCMIWPVDIHFDLSTEHCH